MPDLSSMFSLTTDKYKRSEDDEKEEQEEVEQIEEIELPKKFDLSSLVSMSRQRSEEKKNSLLAALRDEDAKEKEEEKEREMQERLNQHLEDVDADSLISNLLNSAFSYGG